MPKGIPKNGINRGQFKKGQVSLRKGAPVSVEARLKMRIAKLGKKVIFSDKHRENLSKALKGRVGPFKGQKRPPFSKEWRENISLSKIGKNKGEKSGRWIKDRTKLAIRPGRKGTVEIYWSQSIKKRDGWKCKINDINCNGNLEAHHILNYKDYPELRYDLNNGITLCHFHHPRTRIKEKESVPYLQELINKK